MTFDTLITEYYASMTKGYPRRVTRQCNKCGQLHPVVTRTAGYGSQLWYEGGDVLMTSPPCKQRS